MEKTYSLCGDEWELYFYDTVRGERLAVKELKEKGVLSVKATVPGNIELDLARAGLLPEDIFKGMGVKLAEKYETYEYIYVTEFPSPCLSAGERAFLRFEGVDCIAEYELNGKSIGSSENALMPFEFDVTELLSAEGKNTLYVRIKSALMYTLSQHYDQFTLHGAHVTGGCHIRKPAHAFGWDIFPRLPSAGLWKEVKLVTRGCASIDEIAHRVIFDKNGNYAVEFTVTVSASAELFLEDNYLRVKVNGRCENSEFTADHRFRRKNAIRFTVAPNDVKLWQPYGYGEPKLYNTQFDLCYEDEVLDTKSINIGIRSAELIRSESLREPDAEFAFIINGTRVVAKGSNWVPLDALHSRDKDRYEKALSLVSEAGCNILRVWGGGVYEQECFYDYCDRHGIMVWQDFMMACQVPPLTDKMLDNLTEEFTWAVRALRNHPCLVLWSGDNENDQGFSALGINPDRNLLTRKLLPEILLKNDPYRAYLPSSPYIDEKNYGLLKKGVNLLPEEHLWGPRDYYKAGFYRDSRARFVSETGYHGCPSPESLKKMFDGDFALNWDNEQWTLHSSDYMGNNGRITMMVRHINQLFGSVPGDIEEFSLASQISQAEAFKYFIERVRVARPKKGGIIWWNLLDGWPQVSDAVVDYYFNKKLAFDYIKASEAPFCIMLDELEGWSYTAFAVNDTVNTVEGVFDISDCESGEVLAKGAFSAKPGCNTRIADVRLFYSDKKILIIHWKTAEGDFYNHYLCGMPPFSFKEYYGQLKKAGIYPLLNEKNVNM